MGRRLEGNTLKPVRGTFSGAEARLLPKPSPVRSVVGAPGGDLKDVHPALVDGRVVLQLEDHLPPPNRCVVVTEAGSYLRLIDFCITQLKAQGPSRTCNESKEEEEEASTTTFHNHTLSSLFSVAGFGWGV